MMCLVRFLYEHCAPAMHSSRVASLDVHITLTQIQPYDRAHEIFFSADIVAELEPLLWVT